ncbi:hypothetical protein [Desulforegula conservatrix]|uniref:hypothetical protein n=1 Tax=Desulforegula conservatrix TaxID=153026 RepID=UPI00047FAF3D|nr:hypothetical protein [Desulforegula conservatrix]
MQINNLAHKCLWVLLCILIISCSSVKDVTRNSEYLSGQGYKPGEKYLLVSKVYLAKYTNYALAPSDHVGANVSFETYTNNRKAWPHIINIVDVGVIIRITKLINEKTPSANYLWVYAEIMNGENKGMEVLVNFISNRLNYGPQPTSYPILVTYDPNYLKKIE